MTDPRHEEIADKAVGLYKARQAAKPTKKRRLSFRFAGAVAPHLEGQYLVKGHLSRGVIVYFGKTNTGKTAAVFDLAAHVASHNDYRGRRTRAGLVVWLALEAPQSLDNRLIAWCRHNAIDPADLTLAIVGGSLDLRNKASVTEAIELLAEIEAEAAEPIAAVVIDTLARAMPGANENDGAEMGAAVAGMDRIRTEAHVDALIAIHHVGKDDTKGPRGHSSLLAAVDGAFEVKDREVIVYKARDAKIGEALPFDLRAVEIGTDEDGDPVTAVVAVAADAPVGGRVSGKPKRLTDGSRLALQVLRRLLTDEGIDGAQVGAPPDSKAASVDRWREAHKARFGGAAGDRDSTDAERQAWKRALSALQAARIVTVSGAWVWTNETRA